MPARSVQLAIVGMSGRFPGVRDEAQFWDALVSGRELISRFTDDELLASGVSREVLADPRYVSARPILENVADFDADFFGISAREAETTDPQLRLLLECAWEALEESGHSPPSYDGTIGIFAGLRLSRYLDDHLLANPSLVQALGRDYLMMINRKDSAATWLSYRLNLHGPAISLNTACSTALVAVHLAANALLNFECDVALAGAAAIPCFDKEGYLAPGDSPWSTDGHCRAFDARASGTLEGAGAGMVALKRLEAALADGDVIRSVLIGSAVNNDGADKVGYTAPSVVGQARVIAEAMAVADVTGDDIGYVEAHGTATALGDPIEIAALASAYRLTTDRIADCPIGSVKTNVGHLGVAAGAAGLMKAALCLERQQVPPSLHFDVPNPAIDFARTPFYVNTTLQPWTSADGPRRAAVSAFGIGGTNAHVILQEPPPRPEARSARRVHILPVSARTSAALTTALHRLADHLDRTPDAPLACVSTTLRTGRTPFERRTAIVAGSTAEAASRLRRAATRAVESSPREAPRLAIGFTTCRGVTRDSLRDLLDTEPVFREAFDARTRLMAASGRDDLDETWALAAQWALAELLETFGVKAAVFYGSCGAGEALSDVVRDCRSAARVSFDSASLAAQADILLDLGVLLGGSETIDVHPRLVVVDGRPAAEQGVRIDEALATALGRLWELGVGINWRAFGRDEQAYRISLPTYPFMRRRHWIDRAPSATLREAQETVFGREDADWPGVIVDGASGEEAIAAAARLADDTQRPLIVIASSAPASTGHGFLLLDPPDGQRDVAQLRRLAAAAADCGYRRLLIVDRAGVVPIAGSMSMTRLEHAVRRDLIAQLLDIWRAALGGAALAPEDDFFELGGDSLIALEMIGRINVAFGVDLRPIELVSAPTVLLLAEKIEKILLADVDAGALESLAAGLASEEASPACQPGDEPPRSL